MAFHILFHICLLLPALQRPAPAAFSVRKVFRSTQKNLFRRKPLSTGGSCQTGSFYMQEMGLEPTQPCDYRHLKPARLPFRHSCSYVTQSFSGSPEETQMRKMGLEPTRHECHKILSLARLPVPTLPQMTAVCHRASSARLYIISFTY